MVRVTFEIHPDHLPSLRSAVDDITTQVGTTMETKHSYDTEDALARASIGLARLRTGLYTAKLGRDLDPHYTRGKK